MKDDAGWHYEAEIEWIEQRAGRLRSANLPTLEVAAPPEFEGREGVWTPEHLYVGAVLSCFMTTFLAIAENSKLEIDRKSTRLNSSHIQKSRMPSSA